MQLMKVYQVKDIIVGKILCTPENENVFTRTIIIKGDVDLVINMYSYNKEELEIDG